MNRGATKCHREHALTFHCSIFISFRATYARWKHARVYFSPLFIVDYSFLAAERNILWRNKGRKKNWVSSFRRLIFVSPRASPLPLGNVSRENDRNNGIFEIPSVFHKRISKVNKKLFTRPKSSRGNPRRKGKHERRVEGGWVMGSSRYERVFRLEIFQPICTINNKSTITLTVISRYDKLNIRILQLNLTFATFEWVRKIITCTHCYTGCFTKTRPSEYLLYRW